MPGSKVRTPKATTLLRKDHDKVKGLFTLYDRLGEEAEPARKLRIFDELRFELTVHATVEDEVFYPAIQESGDPDAETALAAALDAHQEIRTLLSELDDLDPDDETFDARMENLKDAVTRHIEEEEATLFAIYEGLPRDVRESVGERVRIRQDELTGRTET